MFAFILKYKNACHGCEKRKKKSNPIQFFFYDGQTFRRQCVNMIDIM